MEPDRSDEEDGRPFEVFTLGEDEIHFAKPTDGQLLIVLGMLDIADETNVKIQLEAVNNFGVVVRSLFTRDRDRQIVQRGLAAGVLDLAEYFELALDMIKTWAPEQVMNREERRADARAPQKRAARVTKGGRAR